MECSSWIMMSHGNVGMIFLHHGKSTMNSIAGRLTIDPFFQKTLFLIRLLIVPITRPFQTNPSISVNANKATNSLTTLNDSTVVSLPNKKKRFVSKANRTFSTGIRNISKKRKQKINKSSEYAKTSTVEILKAHYPSLRKNIQNICQKTTVYSKAEIICFLAL